MDPEIQSRVFEPFFTTKGKGAGTGLGLATVYGVVRQHGGQIELHSAEGRGSTFSVYLPHVKDTAAPVQPRVPSGEVARGFETILVAEDDDRVRELACTILRECGYVVYDAPNAEQAQELYDYIMGPVDLLLTDVIMPGMKGPELYRVLSEADPHLKVLYVSGYPSDALAPHGILDEKTPLLPKPFTEVSLTQKVREVLEG
jgi:CheY-like chemotaxis protein